MEAMNHGKLKPTSTTQSPPHQPLPFPFPSILFMASKDVFMAKNKKNKKSKVLGRGLGVKPEAKEQIGV